MSYLKRMMNNPHCFGGATDLQNACKPPCGPNQKCVPQVKLGQGDDPMASGKSYYVCKDVSPASRRSPMMMRKRLDPLQRKLQSNTFKAKRNRR